MPTNLANRTHLALLLAVSISAQQPDDTTLRGRVVLPDGAPAAKAEIQIRRYLLRDTGSLDVEHLHLPQATQRLECGDDGISAHESAQYRVDGFISIGNSAGICDTGTAQTSYNRVFIADCHAFDLYFLDEGRYKLTNAVIFSKAQNPFTVTSREDQHCELEMDNVLFRRLVEPRKALIAKTAVVRAKRLSMENITFDARGELQQDGPADVAELLKLVPNDYQP